MPTMNPQNLTDLGQYIRRQRLAMGIDQSDFAKRAGLSRNYISLIESGHASNLTVNALAGIAQALDTTISELVAHL